jgi:hypothetical protein
MWECVLKTPAEIAQMEADGWVIHSGPHADGTACAAACTEASYYCVEAPEDPEEPEEPPQFMYVTPGEIGDDECTECAVVSGENLQMEWDAEHGYWLLGVEWAGCSESDNAYWVMQIVDTTVNVYLAYDAELDVIAATYSALLGDWDQIAPLTLPLQGGDANCSWPAEITVNGTGEGSPQWNINWVEVASDTFETGNCGDCWTLDRKIVDQTGFGDYLRSADIDTECFGSNTAVHFRFVYEDSTGDVRLLLVGTQDGSTYHQWEGNISAWDGSGFVPMDKTIGTGEECDWPDPLQLVISVA